MADSGDKSKRSLSRDEIRIVISKGEERGRDGGKPRTPGGPNGGSKRVDFGYDSGKPKTPVGEKKWEPPKKGTTPSNRKRR